MSDESLELAARVAPTGSSTASVVTLHADEIAQTKSEHTFSQFRSPQEREHRTRPELVRARATEARLGRPLDGSDCIEARRRGRFRNKRRELVIGSL